MSTTPDESKESKMGSVKGEAKRFCETTSIKGVSRVMRSQSKLLCVIWTVAVLGFLFMASYQTVILVLDYLKYGTITLVSEEMVEYDSVALNPDLIICNSKALTSEFSNSSKQHLDKFQSHLGKLDVCDNCSLEEFYGQMAVKHELSSLKGLYQFMGKEEAAMMSHRLDEMIVKCETIYYLGGLVYNPCPDSVVITPILSMNHLNCFKVQTGDKYALGYRFVSYIDNFPAHNYFESSRDDPVGLFVYLLEQKTMWSSLSVKTWLHPGTITEIQYATQKRDLLPPPYGSCEEFESNSSLQLAPYKKTLGTYISLCVETEIAHACSCSAPTEVSFLDELERRNNLSYCGNVSLPVQKLLENMKCATETKHKVIEDCISSCRVPCSELSFSPRISSSQWPSLNDLESFHKSYIKGRSYEHHFNETWQEALLGSTDKFEKLIRNNFVKFDIIPSDYRYLHMKDEPKVKIVNLVSQLGGVLNLWAGITVVIIIELVEAVIRIFIEKNDSNNVNPFNK